VVLRPDVLVEGFPGHQFGQVGLAHPPRGINANQLAVAQHSDPRRDFQHFGQAVADKDNSDAVGRQRADDFQQPRWDLTVKMDANGGMRPISLSYEPPFRIGDRVHVYGTQLELLNP
jgi:hypothetical protein